MKITRVSATPLNLPVSVNISGRTKTTSLSVCLVDIETDTGLTGKALGQPCWRLLGGARSQVPVYATFGFAFFDREELAEAAKNWVARGFKRLKMTVGHHGLQRRDEPRPLDEVIAEDVQRIRAVCEAVGPDVQIYIDANCSLDYFHALALAQRVERYGISFFEEPVSHNGIPNLAKLRSKTSIALAAGQNEGLASRFRDLLVAQAVDVVQPNACISGGFTQCLRRRHGGGIQHTVCQRRRLAAPQHAPARRTGQWLAGGIPLGRGGVLQAGVRRPARTRGRPADIARNSGAGVFTQSRAHRRVGQPAAVTGYRQGLRPLAHP
jgi:hypothetical protein